MKKNRLPRGMSLLDVVIILALLTLAAGMLVPESVAMWKQKKVKSTEKNLKAIEKAVLNYFRDTGQFPFRNNLRYLYQNPHLPPNPNFPGWNGPYIWPLEDNINNIKNTVLYDSWGRPYRTRVVQTFPNTPIFEIKSLGEKIKKWESEDDIVQQVDTSAVLKFFTEQEIQIINTAIEYYEKKVRPKDPFPPTTGKYPPIRYFGSWSRAYRFLKGEKVLGKELAPELPILPSGDNTYLQDAWRTIYRLELSSGKVRSIHYE